MLLAGAKAFAYGAAVGALVMGAVAFTTGYRLSRAELDDLKTRLATQQVKVVATERVVDRIVYQDRIIYQDKVKVVKEQLPFIVEREVYKNVCLDDDGVKAFNTLMGR